MPHRATPFLLAAYRGAVVAGLALLVHFQVRWAESGRSGRLTIAQARQFFPAAARIELRDPERGLHYVTDGKERTIGVLLTTSPETDDIIGYSGPNNLLVALGPNGAIVGVDLLHSGDTPEHVELVRKHPQFLRSLVGWNPARDRRAMGAAPGDRSNAAPAAARIEGVAGATLTSYAIVEAVQRRLAGATPSLRFPDPVTFLEIKALFPDAASSRQEDRRLRVLDARGNLLGFAARTSPEADNVSGYRGPTEALVALAPDGRTITGIRLRKTYDTESYVDQVRDDDTYLRSFIGRTIDQVAALDYKKEKVEGVSGATQTSFAIAEGLKRRFASDLHRQKPPPWRPRIRDWAFAAIIAGACVMAFTPLRGHRWVRAGWQAILIGYVGFATGDLLSLSLFGGWAAHGIAFKAAPGLALLAAASFLFPLASRRQLYCHQICPHGAAQQWLGAIGARLMPSRQRPHAGAPGRGALVRGLARWLEVLPAALLSLAVLSLLLRWPLDLSQIEPFDAWNWRAATTAVLVILVAGLAASLFIPQAYCRFGCPTGALLAFLRSAGSADRWRRRDTAALVLAIGCLAIAAGQRRPAAYGRDGDSTFFKGRTMGTTWSVKIRGPVRDRGDVQRAIAAEYDVIEDLTSHWRTNTPVGRFNAARSTNAMAVPPELPMLARWSAEISEASDGAFDITVGPLVKLWGFGPAPRREKPPSDAEIEKVRATVGWNKLAVGSVTLQKLSPDLELDLSALVPGWANDRVVALLEKRGFTNFLVESGGELRARGTWTIEIEHPARTCTLRNESIGTSGTYRQNWSAGGRVYSHLIDPRTGQPINHRTASVSVRLPDCARADAWAAALNVLGVEDGIFTANKLGLAAQFVTEQRDGTLAVRESARWEREAGP